MNNKKTEANKNITKWGKNHALIYLLVFIAFPSKLAESHPQTGTLVLIFRYWTLVVQTDIP